MTEWRRVSTAVQLAAWLRQELVRGRWRGKMPGVIRLANELGVARDSVEEALRELERQGVLRGQGWGRGRVIDLEGGGTGRSLRVALQLYEASDTQVHYIVELQHLLIEAGHQVLFTPRGLVDLRMDVPRVARMVGKIEADAWVVVAGSGKVLEWFAAQPTPVLALFGRRGKIPIAGVGPDHLPVQLAAVRRLVELGHRRIVILVRQERRIPEPGSLELAVLAEIARHDIPVGPYNLPNWEDTREGLHRCLDELYRVSPPTAFMIAEASIFTAVQQHLARRGILAPQHVSLVCTDPDPAFAWFEPPITHIRWDGRPLVRHIVRWVAGVTHGKNDRRQLLTKAEFVEGGTIGPVKK